MDNKPDRSRISHQQFYQLCLWIEKQGDDLWDVAYPERAAMATAQLGCPVTPSKVREASVLTGNEHHVGRINVLYWALFALAASGGTTLPNLARKGRELAREMAKAKGGDLTPDLFPEAPAASEDFLNMADDTEIPDMVE